jgi:legumain
MQLSVSSVLLAALLVLGAAFWPAAAEHWAVIVAGSRGYSNYRHQADACHAYHVVRRHGIPAENVVLMMYDDVAGHKENPFPGKLFNKPARNASNVDAGDVYSGCVVDYRGEDVTPDNFVNVLLGNATGVGGKKVLNSTVDDRVFINFVDHGSRGNVYFPHGEALSSSRLNKTLKKMHQKNMYKELVFYLEGGCLHWRGTSLVS